MNHIEIKLLFSLPKDVAKIIYRIADQVVQPQCCFGNAMLLSQHFPDVDYVEGYYRLCIHHAWNCYKGIHFDITSERFGGGKPPYKAVIQGCLSDLEEKYPIPTDYPVYDGMVIPFLNRWQEKRSH
jgi:hypothetical protein